MTFCSWQAFLSFRNCPDEQRVLYEGYWIKTCPVPADSLQGKKSLIEASARRLFNHTEHGLNIPGCRLDEARANCQAEAHPARQRVKAGILAGSLFTRGTDIFRPLVDLRAGGIVDSQRQCADAGMRPMPARSDATRSLPPAP